MLEDYTPSSKNGSFPWSMLVWGVVTWFSRSSCGLTRLTKVLRISAQTIYSSTHYTHSYATAVDLSLSLSPCCGFCEIMKPAIQTIATKKPQGLSEGILCGLTANYALQQCSQSIAPYLD